ncbi:pentatricopeptide repeat-containing protein [Quercus suber]|uniref:Pentatricopeptide repeat-containing protein n=1 Tax=Quercus suber TaxID=58331 RepID=A0AAW0KIF4_QUESU
MVDKRGIEEYTNLTQTTAVAFLSPTQPSEDDEYASSSSLSSSYANSTATDISGYTHNLNPTKTSTPLAQGLFDASRVVQILNSMKRDPKTAISFFDRLKEQGFAHDVSTYAALVRILCHWGLDRKSDAVFLEVIVGSSNGHRQHPGFEISDLFERLVVVEGLQADETLVRAYNALVNSYVSIGMFDEAIDVLFQTKRRGFIPHIFTCNFLMNRLIEHGNVDMAVAIFEQLKRLGGKVKEAEEFLWTLEDKSVDNHSRLANGSCEANCTSEAYKLFVRLSKQGVLIKKSSCVKLLTNLCLEGVCDGALVVLETMLALNVEPSEIMYSKVLAALCRAGDMKKARWQSRKEALWVGLSEVTHLKNAGINKKRERIAIIRPFLDSNFRLLMRGMYLDIRSETLYIAIRTAAARSDDTVFDPSDAAFER